MRKIQDNLLFFLLSSTLLIFSLHGPEIGARLFNEAPWSANESSPLAHLILILGTSIILAIRSSIIQAKYKGLFAFLAGFISVTLCQIASVNPSINGFLVQLAIYVAMAFVVFTEPYLALKYSEGFLEKMFGAIVSALKYLILIYVAGVAALKYISEQLGDSPQQFIAQFIYPTLVLIGIVFMVCWWILLPIWEGIVHETKTDSD